MAQPRHAVAVIGGATSGAELAGRLAERGTEVVVFEQSPLPYGKIMDGLPRWHVALRRKEYETVNAKLARDGVQFVPNTRVGDDVDFAELAREWGFTAVVLASGAWNDRPLPIEGADAYVNKGLVYQNPFIIWFNHSNEAGYVGETFDVPDDAIVVGGGLASIDVTKVLMLETTREKLRERGIEVPLVELEVKGIPKTLAAHDLTFEELGLKGSTLFYRRRAEDMPLVEIPADADEKRRAKMAAARGKALGKALDKYLFRFEPCSAPESLIVEEGRLVGLTFRRTRIEDGRVVPTDETFEARGSCVFSSIGSIPVPMDGIPMKGELYAFSDWDLGRLPDYPNVFSVGNIVTGKGNIVASRKHAGVVAEQMMEHFLGVADDDAGPGEAGLLDATTEAVGEAAERIADVLGTQPAIAPDVLEAIRKRVAARQAAVDFDGDYAGWIERNTPPDLE